MLGGLPSYLAELRPDRDLWANVEALMLDLTARLAEEPEWYRYGDLRGDAVYASILRAIASGHRRPSDVARAIGRGSASEVVFQFDRLRELGLIEREVPIHEREAERSTRALYRLADHYLAFWYRYVDRLRHLIAAYRSDLALADLRQTFDEYVSAPAFEDVCRQFVPLAAAQGRLPEDLLGAAIGSWWTGRGAGRNGGPPAAEITVPPGAAMEAAHSRGEVPPPVLDIVAMRDGRTVLVGECKWSAAPAGLRELNGFAAALRRAHGDLRPVDRPWRAIFSRAGFDSRLRDLARDPAERLSLFTPEDLYAVGSNSMEEA